MWGAIVVSSPPAAEPIDTTAAKAHLRVADDDEDSLIDSYVAAARSHVERVTGTKLITQTVVAKATSFADLARLPIAPVQSVAITYVDADGVTQTLASSVYETRLFGLEPSVILAYGQTWPTTRLGSLITLTAVVGYGNAGDDVPADLVAAVKLLVGDLYNYRETVAEGAPLKVPAVASAANLIENHRLFLI